MMRVKLIIGLIIFFLILPGCTPSNSTSDTLTRTPPLLATSKLPEPRFQGDVSLEESLVRRRSVREYSSEPLSLEELSQLLWAGQGLTSPEGFRTAPSAGALYPLELYVVAGNLEDLSPGIYHYQPEGHELATVKEGDIREELAEAALNQTWVREGAIDIIITAVYERTTRKYGDRGIRYAQMEAGHAAQNICLQAAALNLGVVTVGAFDDNKIKDLLNVAENETPLYVMPSGKKLE